MFLDVMPTEFWVTTLWDDPFKMSLSNFVHGEYIYQFNQIDTTLEH